MSTEQLFIYDSLISEKQNFRFLPRFPVIAFSSSRDLENLDLDYPAGRIIDVIIVDIPEPVFLIDGLGHNLDKKGPWSKC